MAQDWQHIGTLLPLTRKSIYVKMTMLKTVATSENGRGTDAGGRLFSCLPQKSQHAKSGCWLRFRHNNKKENFADFNSVLVTIIGVCANGAVALIVLILLLILAWNYIKLLFEAAERYVLLGVMVFTAPVVFAMGASQATSSIFKSWCRMFAGQIFLLLMRKSIPPTAHCGTSSTPRIPWSASPTRPRTAPLPTRSAS